MEAHPVGRAPDARAIDAPSPRRRRTLRRLLVAALTLVAAAPRARAANVGEKCTDDRQCVVGSICSNANVCVALSKKKSIVPFYFHQPGDSGYRHITPLLYFHTWDKHDDTRVQVPFFGWHRDKDKDETTTVVPLAVLVVHDVTDRRSASASGRSSSWAPTRTAAARRASCRSSGGRRPTATAGSSRRCLLSGGQRDDKRDITEVVIGLVGYYRRHADVDTWHILFPLFFDHETHESAHLRRARSTWSRSSGGPQRRRHLPALVELPRRASRLRSQAALAAVRFDLAARRQPSRREQDDSSSSTRRSSFIAAIASATSTSCRPCSRAGRRTTAAAAASSPARSCTSHDPPARPTSLFPIYWRFHDRVHDATTHILVPIAGFHHHTGARRRLRRPHLRLVVVERRAAVGAPAWRRSSCSAATARALTRSCCRCSRTWPTRASARQTTAVGPLFWRTTPDGGDGGLFPLALRRPPRPRQLRRRPRRSSSTRATATAPPTSSAPSTSRTARQLGRRRRAARLLRPRRHALAPGRLPARVALRRHGDAQRSRSSSARTSTVATATKPPTRSSRSSTCAARRLKASASGPSAAGAARRRQHHRRRPVRAPDQRAHAIEDDASCFPLVAVHDSPDY